MQIINSFVFINHFILLRVAENSKPVPETYNIANLPTCRFIGGGRKLETPDKIHTDTVRTSKTV